MDLLQKSSYYVAHKELGGVISFTRDEAFLVRNKFTMESKPF